MAQQVKELIESNPLQGSRLVGSDDSLAIEMRDGKRISVARGAGCLPPASAGGLVKIDCTPMDGPAHYFDERTGAMIESCSFWFPDPTRCPPKRWPIEVADCDGAVPAGIIGTWRFHALPAAAGYYEVTAGWTMTLGEASIEFDFRGSRPRARSYKAVDGGNGRYRLQIEDAQSATSVIEVELASCGLLVEGPAQCDEFCENLASEVPRPTEAQLRAVLQDVLGDGADEATVERALEAAQQQLAAGPEPLFPQRVYFHAVAVN